MNCMTIVCWSVWTNLTNVKIVMWDLVKMSKKEPLLNEIFDV